MTEIFNWLAEKYSEPVSVIAQLVGFIPLVLSFFTFLYNDRRKIIVYKTASDLLWALHFLLLGEYVGCAVNAINTLRDAVFQFKGKKWASHTAIPVIFGAMTLLASLIRWQEWYSLLPTVGSLLALIGFWCSRSENIRKFNLPAVILWLIYGAMVGSLSTVICNLLSVISIAIAEVRSTQRTKRENLKENSQGDSQ